MGWMLTAKQKPAYCLQSHCKSFGWLWNIINCEWWIFKVQKNMLILKWIFMHFVKWLGHGFIMQTSTGLITISVQQGWSAGPGAVWEKFRSLDRDVTVFWVAVALLSIDLVFASNFHNFSFLCFANVNTWCSVLYSYIVVANTHFLLHYITLYYIN